MKYLLFVAIGGAFGAVSRFLLSTWVHQMWEGKLPLGTLAVNMLGSFAIGVVYVMIERQVVHPDWRGVLMVGFLGAFTTFSTFSLEAITLLENGQLGSAAIYVSSSLLLCVLATWLAISLTRLV